MHTSLYYKQACVLAEDFEGSLTVTDNMTKKQAGGLYQCKDRSSAQAHAAFCESSWTDYRASESAPRTHGVARVLRSASIFTGQARDHGEIEGNPPIHHQEPEIGKTKEAQKTDEEHQEPEVEKKTQKAKKTDEEHQEPEIEKT